MSIPHIIEQQHKQKLLENKLNEVGIRGKLSLVNSLILRNTIVTSSQQGGSVHSDESNEERFGDLRSKLLVKESRTSGYNRKVGVQESQTCNHIDKISKPSKF